MNLKKIKWVFVLFLLTGCNVEYKLNIDKTLQFHESIEVNVDSIQDIEQFNKYLPIDYRIDDYSAFESKLNNIEYYKFTKTNNKVTYDYNHEINSYNYSSFAKNCYEYVVATETSKDNESTLILSTSKEFLCFDKYENLDNVKVKLTSKYQLIDTNADEINRHEYIWHIDKNNAYGKNIYLKLDTSKEDLTFWEKLLEGEYTNIFTVSLLLLLIGFIIYYILKRKSIKRDEI